MKSEDALVGLWFEVGGGLGRIGGQIIGKAGPLYLVRKEDAEHLELVELDDLRSAKFFERSSVMKDKANADKTPSPAAAPDDLKQAAHSEDGPTGKPADPALDQAPQKRRLSEQIRRAIVNRENPDV